MNRIHYAKGQFAVANLLFALQPKSPAELNAKFLYYLLSARLDQLFVPLMKGTANVGLKLEEAVNVEIPLPSIEEQDRIAINLTKLDGVVDGVLQTIDNWQIDNSLFSGTELVLSDISDIGTGSTPSRSNPDYFGGEVNWVLTAEVSECDINKTAETLTEQAIKDYRLQIYPADTILVAMYGQGATRGKAAFLNVPAAITQNCAGIVITREDVLPRYVYYYLRSIYEAIRGQEYSGGGVPHLNLSIIANIRVPIPSLEQQQAVVVELGSKNNLLADLRKLKEESEAAAAKALARIWES